MKIVSVDDVRNWYLEARDLAEFTRTIGRRSRDGNEGPPADLPIHLEFAVEQKAEEAEGPVDVAAFDSIPFYSLCRGLFLPLCAMSSERCAQVFGVSWQPSSENIEALARRFLAKEIGLTLKQKIACLLGDPFLGKRSTFRRDSLIRLLRSMRLLPRNLLLDRLTKIGDVAVLFAESCSEVKGCPPLTSLEVLETLRFIPTVRRNKQFVVLRSLFERCGKLEAFFLAKLLMRNAGFGFDYQGPLLSKLMAEQFKLQPEQIEHAMALTDPLHVANVLMNEGAAGLRQIQLKPLSPVRPALATGSVEEIKKYPVWVERKYDGIRLLLHKSTDSRGAVLCGAYTRNRGDWLEMIPGMQHTIRMLPAGSVILDGELYGIVVDLEGARPASVYEVYTMLQGEPIRPVQLKYAAFDILYLQGNDLTHLPLHRRRQYLSNLLTPMAMMPTPIPLQLTEGQMAETREDVNRLFHHFRNQGYEGIIAKDLEGAYHLASRDPAWVKRKPEITLDLVLLGGVLAVTSKENAGMFGSYVIGARNAMGGFDDVGDVAGLDRARDQQIQSEVMRLGLLTGRRIERASASGVRPGLEFRPAIVVTVKFEGIVRDGKDGDLRLRDPKIALIRSDKSAFEADDVQEIDQLYLDQRMG
jgi:DNA ligase-1